MLNINDYDFTVTKDDNKYHLYHSYMPDILLAISKLKLLKLNGKISAEQTLKSIDNEQLKTITRALSATNRSDLYMGPAKFNTRYCSLVPLFMSAFKEYNDVGYEEWDKTDPYLKLCVGVKLYEDIMPYIHGVNYPIRELRPLALNYHGKEISKTAWPRHMIHLPDSTKWKGNNLARSIYLQTWMANVQHRDKFMILDLQDWDNIPKALDTVLEEKEPVEPVGMKDPLPF